MIYGTQFSQIKHLQPVDKDQNEEEGENGHKKKKVLYQGRSWAEQEEELPVQLKPATKPKVKNSSTVVYADRLLIGKAKKFFLSMTTLEEKVAQLCFLNTEAIYDSEMQQENELLIQVFQIGGFLFRKGDYRRQMYLIERFQEVSKTPLLIANDFHHGMSFYLQGDPMKEHVSNQHYIDLGKAVMAQNRRIGVHVQFDRERRKGSIPMNELQAEAFRRGIREAQGIVGKEKSKKTLEAFSNTVKNHLPSSSLREHPLTSQFLSETYVQETIGYRVLTFFEQEEGEMHEESFLQPFDIYLFSKKDVAKAIQVICKLVRDGKIREEDLDRRVMKVLIIKALYN